MVGLAVDVEENGVGVGGDDLLQVCQKHRILELVGEEIDGSAMLPVVGMLVVLEQIG